MNGVRCFMLQDSKNSTRGDMEKELPKDAKMKRLRHPILATDEWKDGDSAR